MYSTGIPEERVAKAVLHQAVPLICTVDRKQLGQAVRLNTLIKDFQQADSKVTQVLVLSTIQRFHVRVYT